MRDSVTSKGEPHMTIIQGVPETIGEIRGWLRPVRREFVPRYQELRIEDRMKKAFYATLIACAMIAPGFPLTAWTADLSSAERVTPRTVVAAGVGYENAETSTITVKTYDAENGAILFEEIYELNVREDTKFADIQPRERIFAGGVGLGTDGLSAFTLRVYDAATGQFLWEGLLNLEDGSQEDGSTHQVVAHRVAPQATVTQVHSLAAVDGQPQFFLRAIDLATGQLVWADHFSPGTSRFAQTEYVSTAVAGQTEGLAALSQQIEFRILMTDNRGRNILWEDTIEPIGDESNLAADYDGAAEILPTWRGEQLEEAKKDTI